MKNKKLIMAIFAIAGVAIIGVGVYFLFFNKDKKDDKKKDTETQEETKANTNEGVIKDQTVGSLEMTNTSLTINKDGTSQLVTSVSNKTAETVAVETFDIYVKDKDGNLLVTLVGYVGGEVPAGETREIVSNVTMDLSAATDISYKMN